METQTQVTKEQHFVPRFYLRGFLNTNNEVDVLDCKLRQIVRPRGVGGICYEDYFYGIKTGQSDEASQQIEQYFRDIEDKIAKNLKIIVPKLLGNSHISNQEKRWIALLMSMIWIRGPMMRTGINAMQEQMLKHLGAFRATHPSFDKVIDDIDRETGRTASPETRESLKKALKDKNYSLQLDNSSHLLFLEKLPNFSNLFYGQDWVVYISKLSEKFVTSDNPVAMFIPKRKSIYGPGFLERTHFFVLTPDICIKARYPQHHSGKKVRRKTLFPGAENTILELNLTLASRAHHYVYATNRKSLEDICRVIDQCERGQRALPAIVYEME